MDSALADHRYVNLPPCCAPLWLVVGAALFVAHRSARKAAGRRSVRGVRRKDPLWGLLCLTHQTHQLRLGWLSPHAETFLRIDAQRGRAAGAAAAPPRPHRVSH